MRALLLAALLGLAPLAQAQSIYVPNQVGPTGAEGALGPVGATGATGASGDPGTDGADGLNAEPILSTFSPSAASEITIADFVSEGNFRYFIDFQLKCSDDDTRLRLRTDSDGGDSFDSDGGSYAYSTNSQEPANSLLSNASASATYMEITEDDATQGVGNSNGESVAGRITIENVGGVSTQPLITWRITYINTQGRPTLSEGTGARINAAAIDAIQILPDKGTLTGEIRVTGERNANAP
jgi:hypothetical protein